MLKDELEEGIPRPDGNDDAEADGMPRPEVYEDAAEGSGAGGETGE